MSSPAISALRSAFNAKITLLTSSMAKPVTGLLRDVDEVIIFDLPWVKKAYEERIATWEEWQAVSDAAQGVLIK